MVCDCHIHMILDGANWRQAIARHEEKPDEAFIRATLASYQAQGYTYLRDGGDRWGAGQRARQIAPEYGIRYRTPLAPLCKAGHYGGFIGKTYETEQDFSALVRQQKQQGADFIKLMISGLMDFDHFGVLTEEGLPAHLIHRLIHIAHEEGLPVMAHCNGAATAIAAAEAGCESIEHGAYLNSEALHALLEAGTVWVPTISAIANLRGKGRFREEAVCAIYDAAAQNLQQFAALGGLIAVGSDAGAWSVPHHANTERGLLQTILGSHADAILLAGNQAIIQTF